MKEGNFKICQQEYSEGQLPVTKITIFEPTKVHLGGNFITSG